MRCRTHVLACLVVSVIVMAAVLEVDGADQSLLPPNTWHLLEPGLEFGEFLSPHASDAADGRIRVLRIDPERFEFRLLNASAIEPNSLFSAKEWCQQYDLVAAINASMYQKDYLSSVSLMRTKGHINNPRLSKDNTILAFDRRTLNVPLLRMLDRQCESFDEWEDKYYTFVQSIRMISCTGRNVWRQQPQKQSTSVIAVDENGWAMFIHVRFPYSTHDLINILLALPLRISRAMYAEGGSEAQLYIRSGDSEYEFIGNYGAGFNNSQEHQYAMPIPNVVAIGRRD
jgi:hypothetical protein